MRRVLAPLALLPTLGCPPLPEGTSDAGPGPDAGPACGNGVIEAPEVCDDGDSLQTNACKNDCTPNVCGDTFVRDAVETCDDGNTLSGDGCSSTCALEEAPPPAPPEELSLAGTVVDRRYGAAGEHPLQGVEVAARSVVCSDGPCAPTQTDAAGAFAVGGLPPQSAFFFDLSFKPEADFPDLYAQGAPLYDERNQPDGYVTTVPAAVASADVSAFVGGMVRYSWLEQVAVECGVYQAGTYTAATRDNATGHPDWAIYSSFVGFLQDASGVPAVGVPKSRLLVKLNGYANSELANACFLTRDEGGIYRGSSSPTSTAAGDGGFVLFKAKNGDAGTGSGGAQVSVQFAQGEPNFAAQFVAMTGGGVGLVTLKTQDPVPPVVENVDFDTQIHPLLTAYGCIACHRDGGSAGFLRFDEPADTVFASLTEEGTACQATPLRVCVNAPERSLMLTKPLLEDPPNHPNASFTDEENPGYNLLRAWIQQGALRTPDAQP